MDISLVALGESDVRIIYETYKDDGEPDSPTVPFFELDEEQKAKTITAYKKFVKIAVLDDVKIGWVFIIDRDIEFTCVRIAN